MKINIKNIGIIENASLEINGLTVITGYNNSGKTTVGKVIYSLFTSIENLGFHLFDDQRKYVANSLERLLIDIYMEYTIKNSREINNFFRNDILGIIEQIKRATDMQQVNELLTEFLNNFEGSFYNLYNKQVQEKIVQKKYIQCKEKIEKIKQVVNTRFLRESYVNEKFEMILKKEFVEQILPLNEPEIIGQISLEQNDQAGLEFEIQNNSSIIKKDNCLEAGTFDKNIVFLDNVFLLDELLDSNKKEERNKIFHLEVGNTDIPVMKHKEKLLEEIKEKNSNNPTIIENILNKEKLDKINKAISKSFDDDIIIADDKIYASNSKINIENLAMGSKVFAILKLLLTKGIINEKTILILDEPEVHLHPEWQSILAEILALMIKELEITVVLTTHSPQFLLALEYYIKKYEQKDKFNVYMTENEKSKRVVYRDVTENIQEAYYRLSKPMFDIKTNMDKLKE